MRVFIITALAASFAAANPQVTQRAIDPTDPGQIGVNPVSEYISTTTYAPGVDNPSVTMTVESRPTIMHIPWGVAQQANGDVVFPVTPTGKDYLQGIFDEVAAACTKPAKNRKRQAAACAPADALREFERIGQSGGRLDFDIPIDFTLPSVTAGDVSVALQSTPAAVAIAFLAWLMAVDGKVNDKEAVKVESSDIHTSQKSTSSEQVPTTIWDDQQSPWQTEDPNAYLSAAQQILAQIKSDWSADQELWGEAPAPTPTPSCGKDIGDMETSVMKKLGEVFCKDFDLGKEKDQEMTNSDAGTDAFKDFKFHLKWEPKEGTKCENVKCEDLYASMATSCSYNSHSMWTTGSAEVDCGKASYDYVAPTKPEEPAPAQSSAPPKFDLNVPHCSSTQASPFKLEDLEKSINDYCGNAVDKGWHWEKKDSVTTDEIQNNQFYSGVASHKYDVSPEDKNMELALQAFVKEQACVDGAEYKVDFKAMGKEGCANNFLVAVNGCDTQKGNSDYWKRGGLNYNDCIEWTVSSVQR